jgi:predicted ester cyclase
MDLYAEDAVQLMPDGTFEGRSAIKDRLAKELAAFADIAHRYVSYIEQGDAFADEWVFVGTHTGPLQLPDATELAATGKRVEIPGMELVKVHDGKIVADNLYYDNLAVAAQFGLLPQPGDSGCSRSRALISRSASSAVILPSASICRTWRRCSFIAAPLSDLPDAYQQSRPALLDLDPRAGQRPQQLPGAAQRAHRAHPW